MLVSVCTAVDYCFTDLEVLVFAFVIILEVLDITVHIDITSDRCAELMALISDRSIALLFKLVTIAMQFL